MKRRQAKIPSGSLLNRIRSSVAAGDYLETWHVTHRKRKRTIIRSEVETILRSGWHEKQKDEFKEEFGAWNYAIRGRTIDGRNLRVAVSFERKRLIVVTAIDLDAEE